MDPPWSGGMGSMEPTRFPKNLTCSMRRAISLSLIINYKVKNKKVPCDKPNTQKSPPWFQNIQHDPSCFELNCKGDGIR